MQVIPSWFSRDYKGILIIESFLSGLSLRKVSPTKRINELALALPTNEGDEGETFPLITFERLSAKLGLMHNNGDLAEQLIIFGSAHDPFLPMIEKLENSLRVIELLKQFRGARCVIQTRSPFIMLAATLLRGEIDYFTVNVALETLSESTAKILTPTIPLPIERLTTLKTLQQINVATACSVFPISTKPQSSADVEQLSQTLSEVTSDWHLIFPQGLEITSKIEQQYLEENFHPLYDWQMARLISQHFLKTHNLQTNQNQHLTPLRENSRIAA